jgi:multidrug efflux pump subunit AcrA (membrane-fusion protein)
VLKLAQIDPMRIEIIAPGHLFGRIRPGMDVEVLTETPSIRQYLAPVSVVDSIVDAASGTFSVRLSLPNPDSAVVGGVRCKARFELGS